MGIFIISGKSGHGKDTFANIIKEKLNNVGCNVMIIHYGDLVKYYLKQYYNWDGEKDEAGRKLLQTLGTDIVRNYDPNYWTEVVARFIAAVKNDWDCILIPDARFVNEVELTKYYCPEAKTIRIERYNEDNSLYLNPALTEKQHKHPSETNLDDYEDFDYYVQNIGLEELKESADVILQDTGLLV